MHLLSTALSFALLRLATAVAVPDAMPAAVLLQRQDTSYSSSSSSNTTTETTTTTSSADTMMTTPEPEVYTGVFNAGGIGAGIYSLTSVSGKHIQQPTSTSTTPTSHQITHINFTNPKPFFPRHRRNRRPLTFRRRRRRSRWRSASLRRQWR